MGKRTVSLPSGDVEVDIVRSSRRTVALYVRPGGTLMIRAPWLVPVKTLIQFAEKKAGWIERQRERLKQVTPPGSPMTVTAGSMVPFMGRLLEVKITRGPVRRITCDDTSLLLTLPDDADAGEPTLMTDAWYLQEAKRYLPARTMELAIQHSGLLPRPGKVSVRKMKRRWGTCHSNGHIWLNRELMKKSTDLTDYVIIHELCHLVHHNHGREYYELLGKIMPDFRERRKRLLQ